jgi:hypothetical protein
VNAPAPREYMSAAELAARTPWSVEAIRRMVSRGILKRGIHFFQPLGPRSQLLFKWSAIVALIEDRTEVEVAAASRPRPRRGGPDEIAAATAALDRLLG